MPFAKLKLQDDYWDSFELVPEDIEFLYNHLLEKEIPLPSEELMSLLVEEHIRREIQAIEKRRSAGGDIFLPKQTYTLGQTLVFPALGWERGSVVGKRTGKNPDLPSFDVIEVEFAESERREFATGIADHLLNNPPEAAQGDALLNPQAVAAAHGKKLAAIMEAGLRSNTDFVRIAGRWFPRALLVDVNVGHLNLAEAVLDMESGGPLSTTKLLETVEMPADVHEKLAEFSLDYALWQDPRFDEVGPAGKILWYLKRLEPPEVLETPPCLAYFPVEYDRALLTPEMLALETELDDELSPGEPNGEQSDKVEVRLLYPHWRAGTLPLSPRVRSLFPTAYQTPRIRFILVDGDSGKKFPGWVVREEKYVLGLREFYEEKGILPGGVLHIRRGETPGEVIVHSKTRRPTREWVRTVLVGADGGLVLAMLKQIVSCTYDERMAIVVPDPAALDEVWVKMRKDRIPFERTVVETLRELTKLNPQSHVHASELYAAVNLVRRCPPGPIFSLLGSRPWFIHVGDMHFRFDDSARA